MSEQAAIDDATNVMCSRFLSGSQRISSHLSWLEEHAEEIRSDVRGSVSASAEKIQATLKYLTDQMDRLPEAQWERFKAMLTLLRAQQNVLDSAEALMQRARANAVPRKRPDPMDARTSASAAPGDGPNPIEAVAMRRARSGSGVPRHAKYLVVVARGAASFRLVLVGMVAVGLAFAYLTFTRDGSRQHVATNPAALTTGEIGRPVAQVATSPKGSRARVSDDMAATSSPPPEVPQVAGPKSISTTSITSSSSAGLAEATHTAPVPSDIGATDRPGAAAVAKGPDERYVPVVFTGKDQANVLQAFAKLQTRYPKVLSVRRAETQPVDLGQKGTWHRLIVLPPGSRQAALDLCDQLLAAGYDRCWVKGY